MTKETLSKAIIIYNERSEKLSMYQRVSDVINAHRYNELELKHNFTTLPIDEDKLREMLIAVRDKLDEEIKDLDMQFAGL